MSEETLITPIPGHRRDGESPDEKLLKSIIEIDFQQVRHWLSQGANPNYAIIEGRQDSRQDTYLLTMAARRWPPDDGRPDHRLEIIRALVEAGAAVNPPNKAKTSDGWSKGMRESYDIVPPLNMAINVNNTAIALYLLAQGADANARGQDDTTPLFWAAYHGHIELCEALLKAGADLNATSAYGETIFHYIKTPAMFDFFLNEETRPLAIQPSDQGDTPHYSLSRRLNLERNTLQRPKFLHPANEEDRLYAQQRKKICNELEAVIEKISALMSDGHVTVLRNSRETSSSLQSRSS